MSATKIAALRRLQEEREKVAAAVLAHANLVVDEARAALGRAIEEQEAFRRRRRAREAEIYATLLDQPVRTVALELLHMELEALLRMAGVVEERVRAARRELAAAEAALEAERARYLTVRNRLEKWRQVERQADGAVLAAVERALELELEDRAKPAAARLGDAA